MRSKFGFTLMELLVVTVIAIIIMTSAAPSLKRFSIQQMGKHMLATLELHVRSSREQAIHLQVPITMCPSINKINCHPDWNKPIIIFTDKNRNNRVDDDERILAQIRASKDDELRSFTGNYIRFNANGFSNFNTGSLSYCSDKTAQVNGVLIISRVGRIRRGVDKNKDGLKELANGNNLPCASR